jgi:hypothetical protein
MGQKKETTIFQSTQRDISEGLILNNVTSKPHNIFVASITFYTI